MKNKKKKQSEIFSSTILVIIKINLTMTIYANDLLWGTCPPAEISRARVCAVR